MPADEKKDVSHKPGLYLWSLVNSHYGKSSYYLSIDSMTNDSMTLKSISLQKESGHNVLAQCLFLLLHFLKDHQQCEQVILF